MKNLNLKEIQQKIDNINFASDHIKQLVKYGANVDKKQFTCEDLRNFDIFKALARQNLKKQSEEVKRKSSAISKIKKGIVIFFKKTTCDFLKKAACFNF